MGNYTRSAYHSRSPSWRNNFRREGKYIGIEFELESKTSYQAVLHLLPNFPNRHRPITESDGSLSSTYGLEIVFPPFLASTLKRKNSVFSRSIAAITPEFRESNGAGMHMNINTRGWDLDVKTKFVAVINNLPRKYLENIGQRALTSYCKQAEGWALDDYRDACDHFAAEFKTDRIEVRFPRSTTNLDRINNLIEFFAHVEKFAKDTDIDGLEKREIVTEVTTTEERTRENYPGGCGCPFCLTEWVEIGLIDPDQYSDHNNDYSMMVEQFDAFMKKGKRRSRIMEILKNGYSAEVTTVRTSTSAQPSLI